MSINSMKQTMVDPLTGSTSVDKMSINRANVIKALQTGSTEMSKKLTKGQWEQTEKILDQRTMDVIDMLKCLGEGKEYIEKQKSLRVAGDQHYENIIKKNFTVENHDLEKELEKLRNKYDNDDSNDVKNTNCNNKENGKGKGKGKGKEKKIKMKKADVIRMENSNKFITKEVMNVMKKLKAEKFTPLTALTSDIMELKIVGFIYALWHTKRHHEKYLSDKEKYYPFVLSVIVSVSRLLRRHSDYIGNDINCSTKTHKISQLAIKDLKNMLRSTIKMFPYTGLSFYKYAPKLIIDSEFDKYLPRGGIKPYKNQVDVIKFMKKNFDTGFLLSYKAMISSGKTTCVVALLSLLRTFRREKGKNYILLFCCNSIPVKSQVARLCWCSQTPFATASIDKGRLKKIKNYNCESWDKCECIVGSPDAIHRILTDSCKSDIDDKYILFLDEPTIGADIDGSDSLNQNVSVMMSMPKRAILSSATLPDIDKLTKFVNDYTKKIPDGVTGTVLSCDIYIGCDLYDYDRNSVIPHKNCKKVNVLNNIIKSVKNDPFLGRIYTHNIAQDIWKKSTNIGLDVPDIEKDFMDIDNLSAENVKKVALEMLEMSTVDDETVEKVCKYDEGTEESKGVDSDDDSFCEESDDDVWEDPKSNSIDFTKLGTSQAHIFATMTLIASIDPVAFATEKFKELLSDVKTDVGSAKNVTTLFDRQIVNYENQLNGIMKKQNKTEGSTGAESYKDGKGGSISVGRKKTLSKKAAPSESADMGKELGYLAYPKPNFPEYASINSKDHFDKYSSDKKTKIIYREPIEIGTIDYNSFVVPDIIMLLLFCGIGIYAPNDPSLDPNYTHIVYQLAEEGRLAYVIANSSISYGVNMPIGKVILTEMFAKLHSVHTIFQLLGRTGRVGRSWKAEAYVSKYCADLIVAYTSDSDKYNLELVNMLSTYDKINNAKELKIIKELEDMQRHLEQNDTECEAPKLVLSTNKNKPIKSARSNPVKKNYDLSKSVDSVKSIDSTGSNISQASGKTKRFNISNGATKSDTKYSLDDTVDSWRDVVKNDKYKYKYNSGTSNKNNSTYSSDNSDRKYTSKFSSGQKGTFQRNIDKTTVCGDVWSKKNKNQRNPKKHTFNNKSKGGSDSASWR